MAAPQNEVFSKLPVQVGLSSTMIVPLSVPTGNPGAPYVSKRTDLGSIASYAEGQFNQTFPTALEFIFDGGGGSFPLGVACYYQPPFAGSFTSVYLLADQVGSFSCDIWKCTYANFDAVSQPNVTQSIFNGGYPTITSGVKYLDTTLSGWTTSFARGDVFAMVVRSANSITRVTLNLQCNRALS